MSEDPLVMPADEFAALKSAARTFGAVVTKPCGCGPDEPCDAHADRSPLPPLPGRSADATAPPGADEREPLGRLVHDTRLAREAARAEAEGRSRFLLGDWEDRSEDQRGLDMAIGAAVAAAERERITGLFNNWIEILMSEPNSHPPSVWKAGFADLLKIGTEEEDGDGR